MQSKSNLDKIDFTNTIASGVSERGVTKSEMVIIMFVLVLLILLFFWLLSKSKLPTKM